MDSTELCPHYITECHGWRLENAIGSIITTYLTDGFSRPHAPCAQGTRSKGRRFYMVVTSRVKKTVRNFRNSVKTSGIGPVRIPKPPILLFTVSKFQKKIKVSKKHVKKLDQILRLLIKKFL
jgi:hypothetical protein